MVVHGIPKCSAMSPPVYICTKNGTTHDAFPEFLVINIIAHLVGWKAWQMSWQMSWQKYEMKPTKATIRAKCENRFWQLFLHNFESRSFYRYVFVAFLRQHTSNECSVVIIHYWKVTGWGQIGESFSSTLFCVDEYITYKWNELICLEMSQSCVLFLGHWHNTSIACLKSKLHESSFHWDTKSLGQMSYGFHSSMPVLKLKSIV